MEQNIALIATQLHADTNHTYDGQPYILHLQMVVAYANKYIQLIADNDRTDVIHAAWLHDTIEDCRVTYNDVVNIAGITVADIVYAVSNEKGKTRKERANEKYYEGIRNTPYAVFVKLCDRLANVQYSKTTNSNMLATYKGENEVFLNSLFITNTDKEVYKVMLQELKHILG